MKFCGECGEKNKQEALFCANCGTELELFEDTEGEPKKQNEDLNFCPGCGAKVEQGAIFCGECGSSFGEQCPNCKTPNQTGAKFCGNYAKALSWVCTKCKTYNQKNAVFCENCGSYDLPKKHTSRRPTLLAVAAMILVVVGVVFWQNSIKSRQVEKSSSKTQSEQKKASSSSSSSSSSTSSQPSVAYKEQIYLNFESGLDCMFNHSISVSKSGNVMIEIPEKSNSISSPTVFVTSYGSDPSDIAGTYSFSWSFNHQCVDLFLDADSKSYSGSFYIDGLSRSYMIFVSGSYINVTSY